MTHPRTRPSYTRRAVAWLVSLSALLALTSLQAETVDTMQKEFPVKAGGRLEVDVNRGGIDVRAADVSQVTIELVRKVKAGSEEEEKSVLAEDQIEMTQEGNTVRVYARSPKQDGGSWLSHLTDRRSFNYHYTITVPGRFNATLKTSGGGINVEGLTGEVGANTSGGGLTFESITGPIDGRTSGGGIKLVACSGEVKVHTSGGGIDAREGSGPLDLNTSGGGITIRSHNGDVRAHTSGGGITADPVNGNLNASTSGGSIRASLHAQPTGECRLKTSGGGITVQLPMDAAVDLDAATSAGTVQSEFSVNGEGNKKKDRLQGPINGGGPTLHLRSSAGSVRIVKGPASS